VRNERKRIVERIKQKLVRGADGEATLREAIDGLLAELEAEVAR
jgi:hypothetical protein